jgi:myo-inositol-1(or 4)-monophosphatase
MVPPNHSSRNPGSSSALKGQMDLSSAVRLRCNAGITNLTRACVATEMGYSRSAASVDLMLTKLRRLLTDGCTQSMRMHGSCCSNMVDTAAGRIDCYFEGVSTKEGPKPWDVTAAALIVREAGGVVRDISGAPFSLWNGRVLVAASAALADEVVRHLQLATDEWAARWPKEAPKAAYDPRAGIGPPSPSATAPSRLNSKL